MDVANISDGITTAELELTTAELESPISDNSCWIHRTSFYLSRNNY